MLPRGQALALFLYFNGSQKYITARVKIPPPQLFYIMECLVR